MKVRAVTLVLALMIPAQCVPPPGKDAGGDNNPRTGACTLEYQETTSDGVHHAYPELFESNLVVGKVIFHCAVPPDTFSARATLETRKQGAGQEWRSRYELSMSRVPRPKDALFVKAYCDWNTTAYWRVHAWVNGTGRNAKGEPTAFSVEDFSAERRITCPGRG